MINVAKRCRPTSLAYRYAYSYSCTHNTCGERAKDITEYYSQRYYSKSSTHPVDTCMKITAQMYLLRVLAGDGVLLTHSKRKGVVTTIGNGNGVEVLGFAVQDIWSW